MKLKKGDNVKLMVGKDKGKTGVIERVFCEKDSVLVAGVNQYKRHLKSRTRGQKSEIVTLTRPLPSSNVVLVCPKCTSPARVGYKFADDKKVRFCKKCEEVI